MPPEQRTDDECPGDRLLRMMREKKPEPQTIPSEAAKKLAATIVKRANQSVREGLGINAEFKPSGLETLIEMYLEDARKEGRREAADQIGDLEQTFELRWRADMRAIERWRSEDPQRRELVLPDHADLCVWLLDKMEAAGVQI